MLDVRRLEWHHFSGKMMTYLKLSQWYCIIFKFAEYLSHFDC